MTSVCLCCHRNLAAIEDIAACTGGAAAASRGWCSCPCQLLRQEAGEIVTVLCVDHFISSNGSRRCRSSRFTPAHRPLCALYCESLCSFTTRATSTRVSRNSCLQARMHYAWLKLRAACRCDRRRVKCSSSLLQLGGGKGPVIYTYIYIYTTDFLFKWPLAAPPCDPQTLLRRKAFKKQQEKIEAVGGGNATLNQRYQPWCTPPPPPPFLPFLMSLGSQAVMWQC